MSRLVLTVLAIAFATASGPAEKPPAAGPRPSPIRAWFQAHEGARPGETAHVIARDFTFELPARVRSGLVRFQFENRGREPHYLRLMRIGDRKHREDVVEWRKQRTPMPPWLVPAGGVGTVAPGLITTAWLRLAPGHYLALCGHPSPDGTSHVDKGMMKEFEVSGSDSGRPPSAARTLELQDSAFALDPPAVAGSETWRVSNRGTHVHQALLIRLPRNVTAESELAWFRNGSRGPRPGQPIGGIIELQPGGEAWFTATLKQGDYLLLCGIPFASGARHFDHGMTRVFSIK